MAISKKARAYMEEVYSRYTEKEDLIEFNVIHMHDTGKCCITNGSGYDDARHFNLIGYNTRLKLKRDMGHHDSITTKECPVKQVRIFIDGSTMIVFDEIVVIEWTGQNQEFKPKAN